MGLLHPKKYWEDQQCAAVFLKVVISDIDYYFCMLGMFFEESICFYFQSIKCSNYAKKMSKKENHKCYYGVEN